MASAPLPTLDFYTRAGCEPCAEARAVLQSVLEERVKRGDPIAQVRFHELTARPDLEADYGAWLPVLQVGDEKLTLTSSYRSIERFLDATLGRLA